MKSSVEICELTDIRKRTALTAVHRSFLRSMIKLNPKSASCSLNEKFIIKRIKTISKIRKKTFIFTYVGTDVKYEINFS